MVPCSSDDRTRGPVPEGLRRRVPANTARCRAGLGLGSGDGEQSATSPARRRRCAAPVGRSAPRGFERLASDESEVVLCLEHGIWLTELANYFDLVWATTWGASANRAIGRRLGLRELPNIDFSEMPRSGTRKLTQVARYVGDRATAWVDDELYEDAVAWANGRDSPTLLRRPSGSRRLTSMRCSPSRLHRISAGTSRPKSPRN